ncbi:MAG: hypothetical protein IKG23_09625 [Clostridia bacterium]|nr:hypothetical protein [Clostridia bacterium]
MAGKKDRGDFSVLIDRVVDLDKEIVKEKAVESDLDIGIDYEAEYRKQTGKDFVTGKTEVQ